MSKIEWTDRTWNPTRGCSRVSEGCRNCYAERIAVRFSGHGEAFEGFADVPEGRRHSQTGRATTGVRGHWTGKVSLVPDKLDEPLQWRKPQRVFVNSMSDLFHEALPAEVVDQVFAAMAFAPQHTFQVLTKRPERMCRYVAATSERALRADMPWPKLSERKWRSADTRLMGAWPLPNVWLGVSVEDQATADERIPLLLKTPAAVRFVSYEPALESVDFRQWLAFKSPRWNGREFPDVSGNALGWIIVGGESGLGARPFDVAWARSTVQQCRETGVACFVKQLGAHPCFRLEDEAARGNVMPSFHHAHGDLFCKRLASVKGGDPAEWPEDLRIREFP